jgi:sensor histidine kinase regulating citrate/malate metabolism
MGHAGVLCHVFVDNVHDSPAVQTIENRVQTGSMRSLPLARGRHRSLAGQLFVMQVVVVAAMVAGGAVLAYLNAAGSTEESARRQVTAVAAGIADSPVAAAAMARAHPSAVLQPYAERVRRDTGVTFVTIMSPEGIRYTHPNPGLIGKRFLGHIQQARAGGMFKETYTGTLGPSVRVVTPLLGARGEVIALVSVGITVRTLSAQVREQLLALVGVALLALALGGAGTYLVSARLRRHTHGMDTAELSRMYEYHHAILHNVREGLLLLDTEHRVALANDGARALLRLAGDAEGRHVEGLDLPEALSGALAADEPCVDEIHLTRDRVVVVNKSAVTSGARHLGSVVTLRDHTDLQALTGELDSVRGFAESLRAQTHEAANRLHAVVSLIELGRPEEAIDFATAELQVAQRLTDQVVNAVAEPVLAALLLGKAAQANERGVELVITPDTQIDDGMIPEALDSRDMVTILGNLIDNAVDAAAEAGGDSPRVLVTARTAEGGLLLRVADTGRGVEEGAVREIFKRGWSTKAGDRPLGRGLGLALVEQTATRHGGGVEVGRDVGAVFTVTLPLVQEASR